MRILITGTSRGIGLATANRFLQEGFDVVGLDELPSSITNPHYQHYIVDVSDYNSLPEIGEVDYVFNNAGKQNSGNDINNNLVGTMNVTKKYGFNKNVKSILFNASASASTGFEFDEYVASKAGIVGYMKFVASQLAKQGTTVNSISLGGVLTDSNKEVMEDKTSWEKIMKATPLKKWASLEEVCDWVYFLIITNKSMSGQDILIDNGEKDLNNTFVWPEYK